MEGINTIVIIFDILELAIYYHQWRQSQNWVATLQPCLSRNLTSLSYNYVNEHHQVTPSPSHRHLHHIASIMHCRPPNIMESPYLSLFWYTWTANLNSTNYPPWLPPWLEVEVKHWVAILQPLFSPKPLNTVEFVQMSINKIFHICNLFCANISSTI